MLLLSRPTPLLAGSRRAGQGHEDEFPPPTLSVCCRFGEATFVGLGGKEDDAPIPAVHGTGIEPRGSTEAVGKVRHTTRAGGGCGSRMPVLSNAANCSGGTGGLK
jgi:hypothetical protein